MDQVGRLLISPGASSALGTYTLPLAGVFWFAVRARTAGGLRQRVPFGPCGPLGRALLDAEEPVGVQPQATRSQVAQGVQCIPDDQPDPRAGWVEPVD